MVNIQFRKGRNRVPILSGEEIDIFADAVLEDFRPELLTYPCAIPIDEIVKTYFGVSVEHAYLSNDNSFSGMVVYTSGALEVYGETMQPTVLQVKEGTIIIDNSLVDQERRYRSALGHDLGHWIFHKQKFMKKGLQSVNEGDGQVVVSKCQDRDINRILEYDEILADVDWMEWHADYFSSALLMPKRCVETCINEGMKKSGITQNEIFKRGEKLFTVLQTIVDGISVIFNVTRKAASIRLFNLGFMTKEIQAGLDLSEHRSPSGVPYHRMVRSSEKTYSISFPEAVKLFSSNMDFQRAIRSGSFLYIGSNFCLNVPKYVRMNAEGSPELTDYACRHMDECCLIFTREEVQYRPPSRGNVSYCVPPKDEVNYEEEFQRILHESQRLARIESKLPATFADTLRFHMKRLKISEDELSDKTEISQKTIRRLCSSSEMTPELVTVIRVCFGLNLVPSLSNDLIHKSGHTFIPGNVSHIAYQLLLHTKYNDPISDCLEILKQIP